MQAQSTQLLCRLNLHLAHKIGCHGNAPRSIEKLTSDRSSACIYSHSSTVPANLEKTGTADMKIIGLTEIAKKETAAEHKSKFGQSLSE